MSGSAQHSGEGRNISGGGSGAPVPIQRPSEAAPAVRRPRQTKIFAMGGSSDFRPPTRPGLDQQPRRTRVFYNPADPRQHQTPHQPHPQQPRRTALFVKDPSGAVSKRLGLSTRLREETVTELQRAKTSSFLIDLLSGEVSRERYCRFLSCMLEIYSALESALDRHQDNPLLAPFYWPALFRSEPLQQDLDFFLRGKPADDAAEFAPVRAWVQRIHELSASRPELLISHAYVRYMRDLSGWPIVSERIARSFRISLESVDGTPPRGLAFHQFPDLPDVAEARAKFRALLDAVPEQDADVDEDDILKEARRAFTLNYAVVLELA